jgi:hypothetical protein
MCICSTKYFPGAYTTGPPFTGEGLDVFEQVFDPKIRELVADPHELVENKTTNEITRLDDT